MKKILLTIFLISGISALYAQSLTGTWNSSFGELRLVQVGNTVVGDYASLGTIEGIIENNILRGRFTNRTNEGGFEWKLNDKKFTGTWWWSKSPSKKGNWNGDIFDKKRPTLVNEDKTTAASGTKTIVINQDVLFPKNTGQLNVKKPVKATLSLPAAAKPGKKIVTPSLSTTTVPSKPAEEKFVKKPNWVRSVHSSKNKVQDLTTEGGGDVEFDQELPKNPIVSRDKSIYCTVKEVPYRAKFDKLYMVAPSIDLQPGTLLDPRHYEEGDIVPIIPTQREPVTLVSRDGGNWSKKATVETINASTQAVTSGLKNGSPTPITSNYEITQVYSKNDLKLALGMSFKQQGSVIGDIGKVDSETEFKAAIDSKKSKNYYLLTYQETLQTVSVNTPSKIGGQYYFTNEPLPSNLLYVSEVGYGKLIYFLIEAESSFIGTELGVKSKMGAEGDAKVGSKKTSRDINLSMITGNENQRIKITALAAGSRAPVVNEVTNLKDLRSEVNSFIKYNTVGGGTPIYYKLKLAKTGQNMSVQLQDKATVRECKLISGGFKVEFQNLFAWEITETGNDEIFGIGWADMYVVKPNGSKSYIMPSNRNYLNHSTYKTGQGRIVEISESAAKPVSNKGILIFPQNERTFMVNAREYGYESLDEVLQNTYLRMRFKPKEDDSKRNEEFDVQEQTINLGEYPKVGERTKDQMALLKISNNKIGVLKYNQHGGQYGVSYTVKPF